MQLYVFYFKFSHDWINKFVNDFAFHPVARLIKPKRVLKLQLKKMGIVSNFLAKVIHLDFETRCVINMDETPDYIDMPDNWKMQPVGDKTYDMATSGHEKTRFTVTITVSADGRVWPVFMI